MLDVAVAVGDDEDDNDDEEEEEASDCGPISLSWCLSIDR